MPDGRDVSAPTHTEDQAQGIGRARAMILAALADLEPLIAAARSSPEEQERVLRLVDAYLDTRDRLPPEKAVYVDGVLDVEGAAEFLGVHASTVRDLLGTGDIRYTMVKSCVRIARRALIEYLHANEVEPAKRRAANGGRR
jgi:excisionase family DNA binding protein